MTDVYAVTGNPIQHSRSPEIHRAFAAQSGEDLTYEARLGDPKHFESQVREWFRAGLRGLNVTLPFKERALGIADRLTERAQSAGAVNTLWIETNDQGGTTIHGDNTDGAGLVRDLRERQGAPLRDARILIIGAGGATRGILGPLLAQVPRSIMIANRSPEKALALAAAFRSAQAGPVAIPVDGCSLSALQNGGAPPSFDLIIQATSAGMAGHRLDLDTRIAHRGSVACDLAYGPAAEPFRKWAQQAGIDHFSDGLGMLVEQAAEAFQIWRGVRPATQEILERLRASLSVA